MRMTLKGISTTALAAFILITGDGVAAEDGVAIEDAVAIEGAVVIDDVVWSADDTPTPAQHTRLTVGGRFSEEVQEYYIDGLVPVRSSEQSAWFLDLRGTLLEDLEQELNAGLVARGMCFEGKAIIGANLFYDVRWTENDNIFNQVGGGVEILSTWVDVRANYYFPTDDSKMLSSSTQTDVTRSGSTRITDTSQVMVYEEALEGFDAEAGLWLPYVSRRIPTAIFVGYYDFSSDVVDGFSGIKLRLESRIHRNVTLDAEWFEDDELNRTDYFAGLRFSMLFGETSESRSAVRPITSRMDEMVQRDFRIRTINSGPIVVSSARTESTIRPRRDTPVVAPLPEMPPPEPNCYLDSEGNVVCD